MSMLDTLNMVFLEQSGVVPTRLARNRPLRSVEISIPTCLILKENGRYTRTEELVDTLASLDASSDIVAAYRLLERTKFVSHADLLGAGVFRRLMRRELVRGKATPSAPSVAR